MITPERFKEIRSIFADISDKLSEDELNAISDLLECSSDVIEIANTRPTPARCDELKTVGHLWEYAEYYRDDRGWYGYVKVITEENPAHHVSPIEKVRNHDELVTRQNAEEVIAAKDARIKELEADNKRLREALDMSEAAISEYYRYRYGGELRGSYDGKPEREGLWKAMYKARAALGEDGSHDL